jgi:hypothetical protein
VSWRFLEPSTPISQTCQADVFSFCAAKRTLVPSNEICGSAAAKRSAVRFSTVTDPPAGLKRTKRLPSGKRRPTSAGAATGAWTKIKSVLLSMVLLVDGVDAARRSPDTTAVRAVTRIAFRNSKLEARNSQNVTQFPPSEDEFRFSNFDFRLPKIANRHSAINNEPR